MRELCFFKKLTNLTHRRKICYKLSSYLHWVELESTGKNCREGAISAQCGAEHLEVPPVKSPDTQKREQDALWQLSSRGWVRSCGDFQEKFPHWVELRVSTLPRPLWLCVLCVVLYVVLITDQGVPRPQANIGHVRPSPFKYFKLWFPKTFKYATSCKNDLSVTTRRAKIV